MRQISDNPTNQELQGLLRQMGQLFSVPNSVQLTCCQVQRAEVHYPHLFSLGVAVFVHGAYPLRLRLFDLSINLRPPSGLPV